MTTNWSDFNTPSSPGHNSLLDTSGATTPIRPTTQLSETHLGYLITGVNNISVQLKQSLPYGGSSDTAFELRLFGNENQTTSGGLECDSNGFIANKTINITGETNQTNITVNMADNRTYWWNILVCDNATTTQCAFNETNYTLYVNTSYVPQPCTESGVTYFLEPYVMAWNQTSEVIRLEAHQAVNVIIDYGTDRAT